MDIEQATSSVCRPSPVQKHNFILPHMLKLFSEVELPHYHQPVELPTTHAEDTTLLPYIIQTS